MSSKSIKVDSASSDSTAESASTEPTVQQKIQSVLSRAERVAEMPPAEQTSFFDEYSQFLLHERNDTELVRNIDKFHSIFSALVAQHTIDSMVSRQIRINSLVAIVDTLCASNIDQKEEYFKLRPKLLHTASVVQQDLVALSSKITNIREAESVLAIHGSVSLLQLLGGIASIILSSDMPQKEALEMQCGLAFEFFGTKEGVDLIGKVVRLYSKIAPEDTVTFKCACELLGLVWVSRAHTDRALFAQVVLNHPVLNELLIENFSISSDLLAGAVRSYVEAPDTARSGYPFLNGTNVMKLLSAISRTMKQEEFRTSRVPKNLLKLMHTLTECGNILPLDVRVTIYAFIQDGHIIEICRAVIEFISDAEVQIFAPIAARILETDKLLRPQARADAEKLLDQLDARMRKLNAPSNWRTLHNKRVQKLCRYCAWCHKLQAQLPSGQKLQQCSRCRDAYYCNADCQLKHWKAGHKTACVPKEQQKQTAPQQASSS